MAPRPGVPEGTSESTTVEPPPAHPVWPLRTVGTEAETPKTAASRTHELKVVAAKEPGPCAQPPEPLQQAEMRSGLTVVAVKAPALYV